MSVNTRNPLARPALFAAAVLAAAAAPASADFHITAAVANGRLVMTTYGTDDDTGNPVAFDPATHLLTGGGVAIDTPLGSYAAAGVGGAAGSTAPAGPFASAPAYYGAAFVLTTDYYTSSESPGFASTNGSYDPSKDPLYATGTYPDVEYEMVGFAPVPGTGGSAANELAYDVPTFPAGYPSALPHQDAYVTATGAPAGYADVLDYQYGDHIHGVELYSLDPGSYDLELVAHDATGQFADSLPVFLRVTATAVPEPASAGLLAAGITAGWVGRRPRRRSA